MQDITEEALTRKVLIFLTLLCMVGVGFASEGGLAEDSLGTGEDPMEVCSGVWMDNSVANRIELDDEDDVIPCLRSLLIAPDYDSFALTIHEANKDGSNHLAYSFFYLCDPEIGDIDTLKDDGSGTKKLWDYNLDGYDNNFDCGYGNTGDASGCIGSYPGRHLTNAVRMVNWYYDSLFGTGVEQNEPVFCIVGGDIAVSAEREETQHAKTKLDNLHMPWVPVIGNHDTYPYAESGESDRDDKYFQEEFLYKFQEAANIFPKWEKQTWEQYNSGCGKVGCQNWAFEIGPNHHLGLDFTKRSLGGGPEPRATLHRDVFGARGTWDWLQEHVQGLPDEHERFIITAHHPLDFGMTLGCRKQFGCGEAKDLVNLVKDNESELAYWFSGHESPSDCWGWGGDDYDDYWAVGKNNGQDTIIEVHFCSAVNRGTKSSIPPWTSVALVRVYSDFVCDFTITPNPAQKRQSVTFSSTSNYYGGSISEYAWNLGDGSNNFYAGESEVSHTYSTPGVYWIKHRVKNSNGDYAYMVRPLKVTGCPNNPRLEVVIKEESPGPQGLMSYLGPPIKYKATLKCWFDTTGSGATFHRYYGGREYPYVDHFVNDSWYGAFKIWHDPLDLQKHQTYKWRVYAEVTCEGESSPTSIPSALKERTPGGDTSSGGCPEISVYYEDYPYLGDTIPFFLRNNTILPHSEHYPEIRMDIMTLDGLKADADHYYLNISENDNETSYIDEAKLWVVDHPEGTEVATSSNGDIYVYSDVADPLWCKDNNDEPCYEEIAYQDDEAFLGDNSSYITIAFPNTDWADKGLLLGTGMPSGGSESAPMPKNYLGIPKKPDGQGGWTPMGEAFARKEPSLWMFDVSDVQDNTFRIDCSGDSCYINYIGLVKLEESGWTKTAMPLDSAVKWDHYEGTWYGSDVTILTYQIDSVYVEIHPNQQLALRFDTLATGTLVRDFVLQTSGFYIPDYVQDQGQPGSEEEKLVFKLEVQQLEPLTKDVSIRYTLPYSTKVKIAIYDVGGRLVNKLVDGQAPMGEHEIGWNGKDNQGRSISAGIYIIKMNAGEFKKDKKIVVVK